MGLAQILVFRLLPALALIICLYGISRRVVTLLRTPVPYSLPLTPAPKSLPVRWLSLAEDLFIQPNLARERLIHWLQWAALHACLALLFLRHLRMIMDPAPDFAAAVEPFSNLAGYLLPLLLLLRIARRMVSHRLAWVSRPIDYGVILLLLSAAFSGLFLKLGQRADLWSAKALLMGFWNMDIEAMPWPGSSFVIHFIFGLTVIAWLPRSPLNHFLTPFFNPIRRMADHARQKFHLNPWDHEYQDDELVRPEAAGGELPLRTILDYRIELQAKHGESD